MKLGEYIKRYRKENDITLCELAEKCGLTHAYLSMLENNKNSRSGKPIVPSLQTVAKISNAIGLPIESILEVVDDFPVRVTPRPAFKNEAEALKVADAFDQADEITKELVRRILFK